MKQKCNILGVSRSKCVYRSIHSMAHMYLPQLVFTNFAFIKSTVVDIGRVLFKAWIPSFRELHPCVYSSFRTQFTHLEQFVSKIKYENIYT